MDNPQVSYSTIDPSTMFKYDKHTNIPWNVTEYKTPRLEFDADLEIKKRKWASQKKGVKDTKYATKKGFYMDYELKVGKGIPSAFAHGQQKQWNFEKMKKNGEKNKVDAKLSKYSYLDRIEMEQKNRKSPGVCAYSLQKSQKEKDADIEKLKKRKYNQGEKLYFYMNTEKLSDISPGAGMHSPHPISPKIRQNKTDYKFWVSKHQKEREIFTQRDKAKPAPGTHDPLNRTLNTFERIQKQSSKASKINYFGLDAKFEYTRPAKKKVIETRPDPSSYKTLYEWKGKNTSPKKQSLDTMIWKGQSGSIYH